MAHVCEQIAEQSGLGQSFVGTTLLALATTLPEFITTVTAVRMGAFDLAVGNVLGSTAFNMALLFVVDLCFPGPLLAGVGIQHVLTAMCVIVVICAATLSLLYRAEKRYWFVEPDAALVVLLVLLSLGLIFVMRG
jgi:cation:H+ antiporter